MSVATRDAERGEVGYGHEYGRRYAYEYCVTRVVRITQKMARTTRASC